MTTAAPAAGFKRYKAKANSVLAKVQTLTEHGRFAGDDKSLKR